MWESSHVWEQWLQIKTAFIKKLRADEIWGMSATKWTRFIWLKIRNSGRLMWTQQPLRLYKRQGISISPVHEIS
jgi:hypothetical protein